MFTLDTCSGGPITVTPVKTGVQNTLNSLDSGFRRNDRQNKSEVLEKAKYVNILLKRYTSVLFQIWVYIGPHWGLDPESSPCLSLMSENGVCDASRREKKPPQESGGSEIYP